MVTGFVDGEGVGLLVCVGPGEASGEDRVREGDGGLAVWSEDARRFCDRRRHVVEVMQAHEGGDEIGCVVAYG